ncbi:DNA excision repair protein ERCC-8-like [Corticium candelabrum]|uniref:DNA excision repair protein ERCC-8-like n=1 Tax=Corticium candelabrum TaxID=121492 RepID=UPI002E2756F6|nr:DNA excision repair protein ERCC-8-like [Corticium candelabrum]
MNIYSLYCRQLGQDPPWMVRRCIEEERSRQLDLSKEKNVIHYHETAVKALDIDSVEGRYLLTGAADGGLAIFDVRNTSGSDKWMAPVVCTVEGKVAPGHQYMVSSVQWYPHDTGMFFTSSTDQTLKVWDANTLRVSEQFNFQHSVFMHHISPMASSHCLIAVGGDTEHITLCDMRSGSQSHILQGHREGVLSVCWSPRSDYLLASGSLDQCILLWDVRKVRSCVASLDQHNGKQASDTPHLGVSAHNGSVTALSFLPDGLHLLSFGRDNRLRLWDVLTSRNTLVNYGRVVNQCRVGCQFALTRCQNPGFAFVPSANNIQMFDIHEGKRLRILKGHFRTVNCCAFHPYEQELYSCSSDCSVLVWSPAVKRISCFDEICWSDKQTTSRLQAVSSYTEDTWSDDDD